mmetsp:Transcript_163440/g.301998  ORF Transcript_163440/g.301998 Transcript_163440/m.301998 type:complete len:208 (+) Transcript_163440:500-1123(+)
MANAAQLLGRRGETSERDRHGKAVETQARSAGMRSISRLRALCHDCLCSLGSAWDTRAQRIHLPNAGRKLLTATSKPCKAGGCARPPLCARALSALSVRLHTHRARASRRGKVAGRGWGDDGHRRSRGCYGHDHLTKIHGKTTSRALGDLIQTPPSEMPSPRLLTKPLSPALQPGQCALLSVLQRGPLRAQADSTGDFGVLDATKKS